MNKFWVCSGKLLVTFVFLITASRAFAVEETQLGRIFNKRVLHYWNHNGVRSNFIGKNGATIASFLFSQGAQAPVIVVLPGRAEPAINYAELAYDLRNTPYSVYVFDHRGQGASSRLVAEHDVGYVHAYDDYVQDLRTFLDRYASKKAHKKVFILAHSMGANIASIFLHDNPGYADAFAITSPMFKIRTGIILRLPARALCLSEVALGHGAHFALGKKKWIPERETFEHNSELTKSEVRYGIYRNILLQRPDLRVGGPSYRWVLEAFRSGDLVRNYENKSFSVPTLVMTAPKDTVVYASAEHRFCNETAQDCQVIDFPDASHHILMERDSIRTPALQQVLRFFNSH